jgi:PAS domain S-box-containing protein
MRLQIRQTHSVGLLAALTIAAMVLSVTFLVWQLRSRELAHSEMETTTLTQMLMDQTQQSFEGADLVLQGVQERLSDVYGSQFPLDSPPTHLLLSARASGMRQLNSIFLVDAQGKVINSSRSSTILGQSVADREYFKVFAQDKSKTFFIEPPVRGRVDNSWTLHMARPLFYSSGEFRGVAVAAFGIPQFEAMYKMVKLDYVRPIALYLADGTLVASMPHRDNVIGGHAPELHNEEIPINGNEVRTIRHVSGDGERQVFALGRLSKYPLLVSVTDDETLSLASWRETAVPIALGATLVIIFTASIAVFLIGKLRRKEEMALALDAANVRYQHTVDSVMDAIVAVDEAMNIQLFNPAAETMFGLNASEIMGKPLGILIPERLREGHEHHVGSFVTDKVKSRAMAPQLEIIGLRRDGVEFPIESTISRTLIGGKLQMTAVLRDVTEQRRAALEMREANSQLRSLSASLQGVREEERTRISRELHDDLGQQLTGLKLSLSWMGSRLKDGRAALPESVDEMRYMLDAAIASVRRISTELRPPILDDLGFGEAVAWLTTEFFKRSDLKFTLNLPAAELVPSGELATALFRIVQEALTNVARHANATGVSLALVSDGVNLILSIKDNGKGMGDNPRKDGIGLVSMRERANSVGGVFAVIRVPGAGVTVQVLIPIATLLAEQGGA